MSQNDSRIPVTVLTGFLGAGKTTLLNRILSENHGQRIAVIENEFGEVGIDNELVIRSEEEIFEMNNGCICCTVRGDLIRILERLVRRKNKFDRVLIETTGLADPGPVIQTFFVTEELAAQFKLDGIITLVDCAHLLQHLDDSTECKAQVAFADVILINKIDLVKAPQVDEIHQRISSINAMAKRIPCKMAEVDLRQVLDVGGFDVKRALQINPDFMEPEYPFEWGGIYDQAPNQLTLKTGPDPAMTVCAFPVQKQDKVGSVVEKAVKIFAENAIEIKPGTQIELSESPFELLMPPGSKTYTWPIKITKQPWAIFTQHHPDEFSMQLIDATGKSLQPIDSCEYNAGHSHDDAVTSVGVVEPLPYDLPKLNAWIGVFLQTKGADIYRSKGVLNVDGTENRVVFQGVHMLMDVQVDRPWKQGDERVSRLIFIGRNLDRKSIVEGLKKCVK